MQRNKIGAQEVLLAVQNLLEGAAVVNNGGRLPPERELAQSLGVSRRQLRCALDSLEDQGVVFRHRGQGTFAAPPPLPDGGRHRFLASRISPDQILDVRLQIEPHIAQLAAKRITPEAAKQLETLMNNFCVAETTEALELADEIFHYRITELAGNPLYMEIYRLIRELRRRSDWRERRSEPNDPSLLKASAAQHKTIYEAISLGDGKAASAAVRDHLIFISNSITDKTEM
ncbi:FadR/GntR family transcriptional regulator [Thioclava indica]|uniref:HTH gntR-type domain-containing protein n=1 Tax=Thioclava indica TaxID=1353528 RepID=A0A074JGU7_9RHOB|nr:FCD domain-containing protein [Thioclava indica]KEO54808.1 hypothetical protein DT23_18105 [Thioclava indica]